MNLRWRTVVVSEVKYIVPKIKVQVILMLLVSILFTEGIKSETIVNDSYDYKELVVRNVKPVC